MNKEDVIQMLEYSGMAYQKFQPDIKNQILTAIDDKNSDVQCFLRKIGSQLVITFRGTDSLKDLITDIRFWKKKIPYDNTISKIRVHTGFIDSYKNPRIRNYIQSFICEDITQVKITGHSYGAALAVLCAVDLQYCFPKKDYEVYLFGCPRVGNRAFVKSFNKRIFKTIRIENSNDLVTKIPFPFLGYNHVGSKMHIGKLRFVGLFSLAEHACQKYLVELFKWK